MTAVNALAESNRSLAEEIGPLLEGVERSIDQKEIIDSLKRDIVHSLINERVMKANAE
jgi:predicted thioredoxin/glutaredoxin